MEPDRIGIERFSRRREKGNAREVEVEVEVVAWDDDEVIRIVIAGWISRALLPYDDARTLRHDKHTPRHVQCRQGERRYLVATSGKIRSSFPIAARDSLRNCSPRPVSKSRWQTPTSQKH